MTGTVATDLVAAFEAWAARDPGRPAVDCDGESWSYGRLDAAAERVASGLRARGVGREDRVGVLAGRSPALVAALLGVLKADAAYVPLDPAYPRERQSHMLADSAAAALVCDLGLAEGLPYNGPRLSLAELLAGTDLPAPALPNRPRQAPPGSQLAYVIYTSGSTGTPKGVMVPRASVSQFLSGVSELTGAAVQGSMIVTAAVSFDFSVVEIFATLGSGGRLVLAQDVLSLCEPGSPVTGDTLCTVPSALAQLMALDGLPERVSTVVTGGEALPRTLLAELFRSGVRRVVNLYGPTETAVAVVGTELDEQDPVVPIGLPFPAVHAYVLDGSLSPVTDGEAGELFVGGAQSARGYQGRPGLTADRFLPDPFTAEPGARMYRTGDLVRRRAGSGVLDYLGRADDQVKVRGFRVEPGEIERALTAHPGVRQAAVLLQGDGPAGPSLVAYTAPGGATAPDAEELRALLRRSLPEHMVPSRFVPLDALPLTPAGKLDRRALVPPPRIRKRSEVLARKAG